ncbi:MAG TPA: DUF397 domain-containing protein [Mycobacteriales bacterium]|jgi:Domain of unknown function (DUF397).
MTAPDLSAAAWRKSTHSNGSGNCVEVATVGQIVAVRDSKDPGGPALVFGPAEWTDFVSGARGGRFDLS